MSSLRLTAAVVVSTVMGIGYAPIVAFVVHHVTRLATLVGGG